MNVKTVKRDDVCRSGGDAHRGKVINVASLRHLQINVLFFEQTLAPLKLFMSQRLQESCLAS